MGLILGKIDIETPKYEVISKFIDFEIRKYAPYLVAEVTYTGSHFKSGSDGGFMTLARFLGVTGNPENQKESESEKIAMTAPVITQEKGSSLSEKIAMTAPVITRETSVESNNEKIAMTAPVITEEKPNISDGVTKTTMQFVLPSKYTIENVPKPTDSRVSVKEFPEQYFGAVTFSGFTDHKIVELKSEKLKKEIEANGWKVAGDFVLARYNPPWTIPFLRRNEILYPVEKTE